MPTPLATWQLIKKQKTEAARAEREAARNAEAADQIASAAGIAPVLQPVDRGPELQEAEAAVVQTSAKVEAIRQKHVDATAAVEQANGAYQQAVASALVTDDTDAATAARGVLRDLQDKADALRDLQAVADQAHRAALARLQTARHNVEVENCVAELGARDTAADALAAAIAQMAACYDALNIANRRVMVAYPLGVPPIGSALGLNEVHRLASHEFYRVADKLAPLPGAHAPSLDTIDDVGAIPAMAQTVKEASAFLAHLLRDTQPNIVVPIRANVSVPALPTGPTRTAEQIQSTIAKVMLTIPSTEEA